MKNFKHLGELIVSQKNNSTNPKFLNYKYNQQWQSFSNIEFYQKIIKLASALKKIGLVKGQVLANYSYQNPYWLIVDLATIMAGGVTVPIFNNISKDNLLFEIEDSQSQFLFTDDPQICALIKQQFPHIKIISRGFKNTDTIDIDDLIDDKNFSQFDYLTIETELMSFIDPLDLVTIVYTSGSTGRPKGVEISHQALITQILDADKCFNLDHRQVALSYLPLAHIFERMVMTYYIAKGLSIYFVDDIKNLGDFLREVKPQLMTSVPRALEKVFARINNKIEDGGLVKKIIAKNAIRRALNKDPLRPQNLLDKIFDKIIYQKLRQVLGGNIQMIICGGSALSAELERFYWNIGVKIYCGYGLTECSPVLATNSPLNHKFNSIGKAFPSVELKIAEDGELMAQGVSVMKQYHKNPTKTAEVFIDGWFKTGDLAHIDHEGFVKIIGRKKEVFKTSNGKFVHPNIIEQKLVQELGFLIGALIIAEGRNFVSALLFVDYDLIKNLRSRLNHDTQKSDDEFVKSSILHDFVNKKIMQINNKLDNWEQIKKFIIIPEKISIESGEITPSMKLKRNVLEQKFASEIETIYANS